MNSCFLLTFIMEKFIYSSMGHISGRYIACHHCCLLLLLCPCPPSLMLLVKGFDKDSLILDHLLYLDDLKLFAKTGPLLSTVKQFSNSNKCFSKMDNVDRVYVPRKVEGVDYYQ